MGGWRFHSFKWISISKWIFLQARAYLFLKPNLEPTRSKWCASSLTLSHYNDGHVKFRLAQIKPCFHLVSSSKVIHCQVGCGRSMFWKVLLAGMLALGEHLFQCLTNLLSMLTCSFQFSKPRHPGEPAQKFGQLPKQRATHKPNEDDWSCHFQDTFIWHH